MEVVKNMWGLQTQAKQGKPGNGNIPWLRRTKATAYKEHTTTARKLRALTTYVTHRYSDDPFNAEDHSEIESDEVVEKMTNELNRDRPGSQETLAEWITNIKGDMHKARATARKVVRSHHTQQNADFVTKWRKILDEAQSGASTDTGTGQAETHAIQGENSRRAHISTCRGYQSGNHGAFHEGTNNHDT